VLDGGAWFPNGNGGLCRIGLRDNAVTGLYPLDAGNPFMLAAYAGKLWIADFAAPTSSSWIRQSCLFSAEQIQPGRP
jgi:hypothetical protein